MAAIWLVERLSSFEGFGAAVDDDEDADAEAEAEAEAEADDEDEDDEVDKEVLDEEIEEDDVVEDEDEDVAEVKRVDEIEVVVADILLLAVDVAERRGVGTLLGHCVTGMPIVRDGVTPPGRVPLTMGWSPLSTQP